MTNKEAIEVLINHISPYDDCKADNEANQAIRLAIKALEARPQGEWEFVSYGSNPNSGRWRCSKCKDVYRSMKPDFKFCPECGARMSGEEE